MDAYTIAMTNTKIMNDMEEKIAKEFYGCSYKELNYDEKELVTWEMQDRLGIGK